LRRHGYVGDDDAGAVGRRVGDPRPLSAARHTTILLRPRDSETGRRYLLVTGRGCGSAAISGLVGGRRRGAVGRLHSRHGRDSVVVVGADRRQLISEQHLGSDARLRARPTVGLAEQRRRRLGRFRWWTLNFIRHPSIHCWS